MITNGDRLLVLLERFVVAQEGLLDVARNSLANSIAASQMMGGMTEAARRAFGVEDEE